MSSSFTSPAEIRARCRNAIRANYDYLNSILFPLHKGNNLPKKLKFTEIDSVENEDERLTCFLQYYFQNCSEFNPLFKLETSTIKKCLMFTEEAKQILTIIKYQFEKGMQNDEDFKIQILKEREFKTIESPKIINPFTSRFISKNGSTFKDLKLDMYYDFDLNGVPTLKKDLKREKNKNYLKVVDKYDNIFYVEITDKNMKNYRDFEYKKK